jgi:cytochrome c-type biogenesis protein CcmF
MGIGPLIAWRRTSVRSLLHTLVWPIGVALVAGIALIALGAGSSTPGLIAYTFSAFVLTTIVVEFVRGTRVTGSVFELVARNRRRYGGYIVHASVVLFAIGVAGSSAFQTNVERQLKPGQSTTVDGYHLTYQKLERIPHVDESGRSVDDRAILSFSGRANGTLATNLVNSSALGPSHNVGIHTNWLRAEDLYVILSQRLGGQKILFQILVKPLVNLIWIASYVFVFGSLVALWPDAREQRRLVARLAFARA